MGLEDGSEDLVVILELFYWVSCLELAWGGLKRKGFKVKANINYIVMIMAFIMIFICFVYRCEGGIASLNMLKCTALFIH